MDDDSHKTMLSSPQSRSHHASSAAHRKSPRAAIAASGHQHPGGPSTSASSSTASTTRGDPSSSKATKMRETLEEYSRLWLSQTRIPFTSDAKEEYDVVRQIGKGTFSAVYLARHREHPDGVALKIIDKKRVTETADVRKVLRNVRRVNNEVDIMRSCRHDGICALLHAFQTTQHIFIVMDYVERDLFALLSGFPHGLPDKLERNMNRVVALSVAYLHRRGIAHRDLKPENILVKGSLRDNDDLQVKLCDFGLSVRPKTVNCTDFVGSPGFFAPEVLVDKSYNAFKADVWSWGAVLLETLVGTPTFGQIWLKSYGVLDSRRVFVEAVEASIETIATASFGYGSGSTGATPPTTTTAATAAGSSSSSSSGGAPGGPAAAAAAAAIPPGRARGSSVLAATTGTAQQRGLFSAPGAPFGDPAAKILSASQKNDVEAVARCVDEGISPSYANTLGQTPLHIASMWGNVEVAEYLVAAGADIHAVNQLSSGTPLHVAASSTKDPRGRLACVKILLDAGADATRRDADGLVPWQKVSRVGAREDPDAEPAAQREMREMLRALADSRAAQATAATSLSSNGAAGPPRPQATTTTRR